MYMGNGIGMYFGIFLSGKSVPGGEELIVESVMECRDGK